MTRPRGRPPKTAFSAVHKAASLHDKLALFETFVTELLPALQQDLLSGVSGEEMVRKNRDYLTARLITIALTEDDAGKAISAIKELMDRTEGKAIERKDIQHRLGKLPEKQIDALLMAKLEGLTGGSKKPTD